MLSRTSSWFVIVKSPSISPVINRAFLASLASVVFADSIASPKCSNPSVDMKRTNLCAEAVAMRLTTVNVLKNRLNIIACHHDGSH